MRKIFFALALLLTTAMQAQQYMRLWQQGESNRCQQQDILFSQGGKTVTVEGEPYATSSVDSITIVQTIFVNWDKDGAQVIIPDAAKPYVTANVTGGDVALTNTNVQQEMEFVLSGNSGNGSLTYYGQYKCKFHLNDLVLTSKTRGVLDIQCGKRVDLILTPGTNNILGDAETGDHKATIYCRGHVEFSGSGALSISSHSKHAISTKEYMFVKSSCGNIHVTEAGNDAFHVGQYFQMNGGIITVGNAVKGDGIQVDATDDPADEHNGEIIIKDGSLHITINSEDCKGLKTGSEVEGAIGGDITITGGKVRILAAGNGSRGIQTDANVNISAITAQTEVVIEAKGGRCTVPADADDPHRCVGIKAGQTCNITGGKTTIINTGNKSRAIQCHAANITPGTYEGAAPVIK